jgi:ATP-binding cassette subfamily B (MDR/TAP) protein 1
MQVPMCHFYMNMVKKRAAKVRLKCHIAGLSLGYSQASLFAVMALVVWFGGLEVSSGRASLTDMMRAFLCVIFAALGVAQAQASTGGLLLHTQSQEF